VGPEDERSGRPVRVLQPGARPPHGVRDRRQGLGLADHALRELGLEPGEPLALRLEHLRDRNAGPLADDLGDVLGVDLFLQVLPFLLYVGEALLEGGDLLLERGDAAVADLRSFLEVAAPRRMVRLGAQLLQLRFLGLQLRDRILLGLPLGLHRIGPVTQLLQLLLHALAPLFRGLVLFFRQGRELDLVLHDLPLDLVDLLRERIDLDPQPARRFVHQVDRLVGEEAVADVALRQRRRRDQSVVRDADAVVDLVALLQPAQDGDRVLERRLAHEHGLEAPLERRILLDVLAVLVERGRAHHVQLAPRQRRLQHVGRVHRPFRRSRPHQRVQLVDEDDVPPLGAGDLLQHGLETLLELAAVLRARDQRAEIEGDQVLVLERVRDVPVHDALRQPFDDRGLADAGLSDQHGIVLGSP